MVGQPHHHSFVQDSVRRVLNRGPVSSLTMRKTSSRGFPRASASNQPVSRSATGFMCFTRPSVSVVMTASPIL